MLVFKVNNVNCTQKLNFRKNENINNSKEI